MPIYGPTEDVVASTGTATTWSQWTYTTNSSTTTDHTDTPGTNIVFGRWAAASNTISLNWATTNSSSTGTVTWANWSTAPTRGNLFRPIRTMPHQHRGRTPEQIAEDERRAEERRRLQAATRQKREEARERSMKLLRSCLDRQQNRDLTVLGHFFVDAPSGRRYRISEGSHGNVKVIDKETGVWTESLCIQPRNVPAGDAMLSQKLMIEHAEEVFRSYANITHKKGGMTYGKGGLLTGKLIDLATARAEREKEAA